MISLALVASRIFKWMIQRTSSPGLSRGLVTGLLAHSVGLSLVLGHASVDAPALQSAIFVPASPSLIANSSYWTMSGRIGALKTLGRGWLASLAEPSAEMMVTVGLEVILACVVVGGRVQMIQGQLCEVLEVFVCRASRLALRIALVWICSAIVSPAGEPRTGGRPANSWRLHDVYEYCTSTVVPVHSWRASDDVF